MKVHQLFYGKMNNCITLIEDPATKQAVVVDPAWDVPDIIAQLEKRDLDLQAIWLTHGHFDHVDGVAELLEYKSVPVFMSEKEVETLHPKAVALSFTKDGDSLSIGATRWRVIHTPGHSPGGQCFYHAPHLITGDTLFVDGCGRCDFESSNPEDMYASLESIKALPDETVIYPGHDYARRSTDTLGNQKKRNPFLKCKGLEDFLRKRMG